MSVAIATVLALAGAVVELVHRLLARRARLDAIEWATA